MGRKAFLAAVCLCLRWVAALGGESRGGGAGRRPERARDAGCTELPGLPVAFGKGGLGGSAAGMAGKGSLRSFLCEAVPGCLGCCGTRASRSGLGRRWKATLGGISILLGETWSLFPNRNSGTTCRADGATC